MKSFHNPHESRVFELINKLYRSCLNVEKIAEFGMNQFDIILQRIKDSPVVYDMKWNESAYDWIESVRKMRDIGLPINHFFDVAVIPNTENSSLRSIMVNIFEMKNYFSRWICYSLTFLITHFQFTIDQPTRICAKTVCCFVWRKLRLCTTRCTDAGTKFSPCTRLSNMKQLNYCI